VSGNHIRLTVDLEMTDEAVIDYAETYGLMARDGKPSASKVRKHLAQWAASDITRGPIGDYAEVKVT